MTLLILIILVEWACGQCTYRNPNDKDVCDMCQSARPYVDSAEQRELLNRANRLMDSALHYRGRYIIKFLTILKYFYLIKQLFSIN